MNKKLSVYFLLLKISYIVCAGMTLSMFATGFEWFFIGAALMGLAWIAAQFYGARIAEKFIRGENFLGLLLAFFLNLMILPTPFFLLSFYGFFVLLNKETRSQFPSEKNPVWLNDFYQWMDNLLKPAAKA